MKTFFTIILILAIGTGIGLAVNCKSLAPGDTPQGVCKQRMIKGDPFEVFGIPQIDFKK